jgi:hypothetical protein
MYVVTSLLLTNAVHVENVAVSLYLQNNIRLMFVSLYNPPDTIILHSDLDSVFFLVRFCWFSRSIVNTQLGIESLLTETFEHSYLNVYPKTM